LARQTPFGLMGFRHGVGLDDIAAFCWRHSMIPYGRQASRVPSTSCWGSALSFSCSCGRRHPGWSWSCARSAALSSLPF